MSDFVTFQLLGVDKYIVDLRKWRDGLREDVRFVARECAANLASEVEGKYKTAYTARTGYLYTSTKWAPEPRQNADAVRYRISNTAWISHILERGTRQRRGPMRRVPLGGGVFRWTTNRGAIKANPIFVPAAIKWRSVFVATAKELLRRAAPDLGTGTPEVEER